MSQGDERGYGGNEPGRTDDAYSTLGGTRQTRTRLPGGDDDGYGRRPARSSRSLIMVVGVVVLLIAAIAFANQGGGRGSDGGNEKKPDAAGAGPTAATGTKPVQGKNGTIASGFAHDEQGAQSAAANYAVALGSADMFEKAKRDGILQATHDPAVVAALQADMGKAYTPDFLANVGLNEDGSTPNGLTFVSRTIPVGTKVTAQGADAATVEVWCTGLVGMAGEGSTKPVTATWFTITEKLKWVGDDWKIESSSQAEGPTPVNGDNRASTADDIAGAVQGYGGFTYAR
ncbi:hypothetical protein PV394_28725 [Streptomyces sp. NE06-03E]|uniref:hypothetical protein n=1 Tax=unclassified Streptomyces TaxID=2593676 RepID=UPI000F55610D|nr:MULTISPECIES: hypothetical protein [unclassified Streptomyces]WSS63275.1 hypothetical protein OG284_19625 [Streptomyces sp. NBC_01177]WSS70267.1 hypothetical protein OG491_19230 [Streptomyces sp. NBC_01175]WSS77269.1 hypothetical protein OG414_19510 [Streptomyces sp. NBC_01174]MDX3059080.1 hypothetical protein [Streptomyces sp. NE06-03E]MDX3681981.1 hypothetical protein [Streptomyces sp. AK04-4c]